MNTTSKPHTSQHPSSMRASTVASPDTMVDTARDAIDSVKSTAADTFAKGQAAVSNAAKAVNDAAGTAGDQLSSLTSELESMVRRNPLAAIVGAAAVGFLAGFLARAR
jgi:ElaB/YqjD/DUF883 family membrane-anchored ribosome-binding protein